MEILRHLATYLFIANIISVGINCGLNPAIFVFLFSKRKNCLLDISTKYDDLIIRSTKSTVCVGKVDVLTKAEMPFCFLVTFLQ